MKVNTSAKYNLIQTFLDAQYVLSSGIPELFVLLILCKSFHKNHKVPEWICPGWLNNRIYYWPPYRFTPPSFCLILFLYPITNLGLMSISILLVLAESSCEERETSLLKKWNILARIWIRAHNIEIHSQTSYLAIGLIEHYLSMNRLLNNRLISPKLNTLRYLYHIYYVKCVLKVTVRQNLHCFLTI